MTDDNKPKRTRDPRASLKTSLKRFSKSADDLVSQIAKDALVAMLQAELAEVEVETED